MRNLVVICVSEGRYEARIRVRARANVHVCADRMCARTHARTRVRVHFGSHARTHACTRRLTRTHTHAHATHVHTRAHTKNACKCAHAQRSTHVHASKRGYTINKRVNQGTSLYRKRMSSSPSVPERFRMFPSVRGHLRLLWRHLAITVVCATTNGALHDFGTYDNSLLCRALSCTLYRPHL